MINKFEIVKEHGEKGEKVFIKTFEEMVEVAELIYYNENHIEIPGIIIFSKEHKGFVFQLMNPGTEILSVTPEDYQQMIDFIKVKDKNILSFNTKTVPISKVRLNLKKIRENLMLVRDSESLLVLNKLLLTTNEFEYQGSGMFSGRENVLFVSKEILNTVRNYIST